mmetsp:Transcript_9019/g.22951  ORF Transcript_9019/g.22951 Transcript_9019/m.22951 type:complete len:266 (+) Transcript_9019:8660-9457(+)
MNPLVEHQAESDALCGVVYGGLFKLPQAALHSGVEVQVLAHRQVRPKNVKLRAHADRLVDLRHLAQDIVAGYERVTLGRRVEAGEDRDGRRLARAVGAEQPEALVGLHLERQVVQRDAVALPDLVQAEDLDERARRVAAALHSLALVPHVHILFLAVLLDPVLDRLSAEPHARVNRPALDHLERRGEARHARAHETRAGQPLRHATGELEHQSKVVLPPEAEEGRLGDAELSRQRRVQIHGERVDPCDVDEQELKGHAHFRTGVR